ncbi:MAG TPA: LCP family protein [Actinomycetales bacterium]|nr:LCP family protein [Actinomycetales bacterium]
MSEEMGERRRRRDAERAARRDAGLDEVDDRDAAFADVAADPEPDPEPDLGTASGAAAMTRRQRREAERVAPEHEPLPPPAAPAEPPAPATPADAVEPPAPAPRRFPVVRPPVAARRPGDPIGSDAVETARRPASLPEIVPSEPEGGRRTWLAPALGALAALVAVLVVALVLLGGDGDSGDTAPDVVPAAQQTVLVTVVDAAGDVVGAALVASGDEGVAALLVPSRLLVDVAGAGRVPLRDALDIGDGGPGQAVSDALQVRVDGTWILTTAGLAQLVDALGGVTVNVDAQVTAGDVVLAPGPDQLLTGAQAAAFATHLTVGETEPVRLARFDQVLSGVLGQLPAEADAVAAQLEALGDASRSTFEGSQLPETLAQVAGRLAGGGYGATVLPVEEIPTGGDETLYGLDDAAASAVLENRFAGALREGAGEAARVLVQNGVGAPGLGEEARNRLVDGGFRYVGGGNAETLGRPTTVVAIPDDDTASRELGVAVAEALGLGPDVVAVGQDAPTLADVVVVLGTDFADLVSQEAS